MNKLESCGKFYVHIMDFQSDKIISKTWTQEIEEPYRVGSSLLFRIPFVNMSIAFGIWKRQSTEEEGLLRAMGGRIIGDTDALQEEANLCGSSL